MFVLFFFVECLCVCGLLSFELGFEYFVLVYYVSLIENICGVFGGGFFVFWWCFGVLEYLVLLFFRFCCFVQVYVLLGSFCLSFVVE